MSDKPSIHQHETKSTTSPLAIFLWTACRRAALLILLFTLQSGALEIPFDDLTALQGILSKKTKHYEIVDPVVVDGNSYTFKIKSPHGEYQVTSITKLLKTCHEIRVIEEYQHTEEGEQVWHGTKEGFKEMGQGAKAVIINPRKSGKAIGASLAKTGRKIGRFFKTTAPVRRPILCFTYSL